jgi:hypothetical protein
MWGWVAIARASTIDVQVTDPAVTQVILECADGVYTSPVKSGMAAFDRMPQGCKVSMLRKSGAIDKAGRWTCSLDVCKQEEVLHAPVSDAPGRLNIILTTELPKGAGLELTCTGYRQRAEITQNTAVFEGVPQAECELYFKSSVPTRYRPIGPGTWSCSISGAAAICTKS